jgi:hypothetical protein
MGEIADMMLDGTMCQGCGEFMCDGADGPGYPGYCAGCRREDSRPPRFRHQPKNLSRQVKHGPHQCPNCDRSFGGQIALLQHQQDKHGAAA